ncbi:MULTISPECIES: T6SS phospholipase effector Tle1-like catalytic domain-containing protein [Marinomonas]|uniref:DUF2235 domain-containing protein n=1 Tax=Marinomonas arctica TaxID=383750 RepID=A0A7H1J445_9GAMM|nr:MULTISPECIES: DUF2235 domain-containing protein [Marinomonas]QNT05261.1 DUF2235 domain-containing protein [Marinomonas arctica]GGN38512.1 hypothetical protein GCM10011350_38550 [Marinomonas arctica]
MSTLFFHFDGTDNSPNDAYAPEHSVSSITNVLKSHLLLGGRVKNHIDTTPTHLPHRSFYYAGIGTYGHWLEQKINAAFAIESGHVATILNRALNDFKHHYSRSTRHIVLIGFSRGAALARRFAALITPLIDRPIIIEAVIDTVASIGWPNLDTRQRPQSDVVFEHGHTLPDGVHRALHLAALDEQRLAFRPTLINHDGRALEIWLAGVHSDIGGGYRKDGIGDIVLRLLIDWIEQQTKQHTYQKARLAKSQPPHWQPLLTIEPKHLGKIHYQQRNLNIWRDLTLAPRHCCVLENDQPNHTLSPHWHHSVTQRIHSNIGYFPIAHCPTPATLWHHASPRRSCRSDETRYEA